MEFGYHRNISTHELQRLYFECEADHFRKLGPSLPCKSGKLSTCSLKGWRFSHQRKRLSCIEDGTFSANTFDNSIPKVSSISTLLFPCHSNLKITIILVVNICNNAKKLACILLSLTQLAVIILTKNQGINRESTSRIATSDICFWPSYLSLILHGYLSF